MFRLQHQFNNIVETKQLTSDHMSEFHCHCKCSKYPTPLCVISFTGVLQRIRTETEKASSNASLRSLWEIFHSFVDRSLWQVALDNLKRLLGDCLRLCFKLAVSLQQCTPHMIVNWVHIRRTWRPLVLGDEIWRTGPQPEARFALFISQRISLLRLSSSRYSSHEKCETRK